MLKKYSAKEENILLSMQLYQLENEAATNISTIERIGDLLPGIVLINNMISIENTYMNNTGCTFLNQSREEINSLGSAYFTSDSFCKEEMAWVTKYFSALSRRKDEAEVTGFYQKVRQNKNTPWKQFYLSGKILKGSPGSFIYMGLEVGQRKNGVYKLNKTLNLPGVTPVTFQKFNSLSKREKEILKLIAEGYTNKNISDYLSIALFTVETHRKNINIKLNTKTLSDLVRISDLFNL